jgi:hypothetical protein
VPPKPDKERDDVLRRMLKTPRVPHRPKGKRFPQTPEELEAELKKNPDLLDDLARGIGNLPDKDT